MDANIRLNNTKEFELEFEVNIQGITTDSPEAGAAVRFVITNVYNGCLMFNCERRADSTTKWFVKLPPLPLLSQSTNAHMFRIEVVVDGYYFEPATGNLILMRDPEVAVSQTNKPKVSVDVKAVEVEDKKEEKKQEKKDDDKSEEKDEKKKVEERAAQAAGYIDGQAEINTDKLVPEFPPDHDIDGDERMKSGHRHMPEDDMTDSEKLEQPTHTEESVVDRVIRQALGGKVSRPDKPGFLLRRVDEKLLIDGIEPAAELKEKIKTRSETVQALLKEMGIQ